MNRCTIVRRRLYSDGAGSTSGSFSVTVNTAIATLSERMVANRLDANLAAHSPLLTAARKTSAWVELQQC